MQRRYPYSECFLPQCSASHSAENERFEQSIISPDSQCLKISQKVAFNMRSELRLHFEWTKIHQKWSNLTSFWLTEATFQTVLPDKPLLIGQKLIENAKIEKFRCDILGDFQTLCERKSYDNGEKRSQCCYYLQKKSQNPQKSQEKEAWRQLFFSVHFVFACNFLQFSKRRKSCPSNSVSKYRTRYMLVKD